MLADSIVYQNFMSTKTALQMRLTFALTIFDTLATALNCIGQ